MQHRATQKKSVFVHLYTSVGLQNPKVGLGDYRARARAIPILVIETRK